MPLVRQRLCALAPAYVILAVAAASLAGPAPALAASPIPTTQADAEIGGPFTLVDQEGRTVTDAQFRGTWLLVYFGYTHCPDACPIALTSIDAALSDIDPARRAKVQAIFITVDPERDTPAVMKDYVGVFEDANIVGLTGTPNQVGAAEAAYRVQRQAPRWQGRRLFDEPYLDDLHHGSRWPLRRPGAAREYRRAACATRALRPPSL